MCKSIVSVVALSVVFAASSQALALSPLEESCVRSMNAVAASYERWTETVCPIYVDVVEFYLDLGMPGTAERLADVYENTVCAVAEAKIAAVTAIEKSCARAGGDVADERDDAIERIEDAKDDCVENILSAIDPTPNIPDE